MLHSNSKGRQSYKAMQFSIPDRQYITVTSYNGLSQKEIGVKRGCPGVGK